MELKDYRVYLGGVLLKNIPIGLENFSKEFTRDNNIYGVYSIASFDLTFVGDGFCILRDLQENVDSCQKTILIQKKCNNIWVDIFDGIIEVGAIIIDYTLSEATCEIQDNSPLVLISRNSDVSINLQSEKDLFGQALTPATLNTTTLFSIDNNTAYANRYTIDVVEAVRVVTEAITGVNVNVTSDFLSKACVDTIYEIEFTGTGNIWNFRDFEITYINVMGETVTEYMDNYLDPDALEIFSWSLLSPKEGPTDYMLQYTYDSRAFYKTTFNPSTRTITAYSNLPIEIISITYNYVGPSTGDITFTKTSSWEDGGNQPVILNYRLLRGFNTNSGIVTTFKDLMSNLNKEYNVYFLASYNQNGGIDLKIEDYQYFANASVNYTFNNANDLKSSFDEDDSAKEIQVGDNSDNTYVVKSSVFTTEFCGIGQQFNAKNDFIIGSVTIFSDLAETYDDNKGTDTIYMLESYGDRFELKFSPLGAYLPPGPTGNDAVFNNFYNLHLTKYHKILRHLNKFKNNVIGNINAPFMLEIFRSYINITNTADNRLFKKYEFYDFMSNAEFESLSDNVIDRAKFKMLNETTYREGLIKSVKYNLLTGRADIIILGE